MRLFLTFCVASLTAAAGCSDPDTLTCDWLAKSDNCWKTTAMMATTCLPAQTEMGTFSADASTCTYASGTVVTFTPPLVLPLQFGSGNNMKWNFTVTGANGQPCLHYQDSGNGALSLTVGSQKVAVGATGGLGESISCPDGTSVKTWNALNLLSCPDAGLFNPGLPGLTWSSSGTGSPPYNVSAGLFGVGDSSFPIFDCTQ